MSNNPMLTIQKDFQRIPPGTLKQFEGLPLGWICDSNGRKGALGGGIQPICNNTPFVGTAFTVSCGAADNLGLHVALKYVQPGDVLVVKGEEFGDCAVTGDLMMGMAQNSGVRAFVTDTHLRDRDGLEPLDIAFFARGINPNGPHKNGPGKIGLPIAIGGHIVESGDLIVGDADNVAVVKRADIEAVLKDLQGTTEKEKGAEARIAGGQTYMELADDMLQNVEVKWVE
jgi:4-hydroxy-4-methyl-2-oxoglutarate aldolase